MESTFRAEVCNEQSVTEQRNLLETRTVSMVVGFGA